MEPRYYTNLVIEILTELGLFNNVILSLLNYMSEDDVYDWAISEGYLPEDLPEEEDEDDDE